MKQKANAKSALLFSAGMLISTFPAAIAIISYFPRWRRAGDGSLLSGFGLLLVLFAAKPIYNYFKRSFSTPAAYTLWFIVFAVFFALSRIADEVTVIAFVGFVSNTLGALFFKAAGRPRARELC